MLGATTKTVIQIPSIYVGCVLGHRKRNLRDIMFVSNTKIVASTKTEAMELFEVSGFPKDIQTARSMMEDIIYKKSKKVLRLGRSKTKILCFFSQFIVIFGLISNSLIHSMLETCGLI